MELYEMWQISAEEYYGCMEGFEEWDDGLDHEMPMDEAEIFS